MGIMEKVEAPHIFIGFSRFSGQSVAYFLGSRSWLKCERASFWYHTREGGKGISVIIGHRGLYGSSRGIVMIVVHSPTPHQATLSLLRIFGFTWVTNQQETKWWSSKQLLPSAGSGQPFLLPVVGLAKEA